MLASPTGRSIVSLDDATVPVPLIHGGFRADPSDPGADLENSYASVNLVRSDLVREFESRGVALARAERENASLMDALAAAEEAKTLAVAEASRWRAAKDELERRAASEATSSPPSAPPRKPSSNPPRSETPSSNPSSPPRTPASSP